VSFEGEILNATVIPTAQAKALVMTKGLKWWRLPTLITLGVC